MILNYINHKIFEVRVFLFLVHFWSIPKLAILSKVHLPSLLFSTILKKKLKKPFFLMPTNSITIFLS